MTTVVWFRNDLRLADNPALAAAAARGPVIPVYVWAPGEEGDWPPGAASRWWLHRSLAALDAELRRHRSRLIIRRGPTRRALSALMRETGAQRIVWNRRYEPAVLARDLRLLDSLPGAQAYPGSLLWEPWQVQTRSGGPYQVFTPFWRAVTRLGEPRAPIPVPRISSPEAWPGSEAIDSLGLAPRVRWDAGLEQAWVPGEAGARDALDEFAQRAARYADDRDRPDRATSRLSPHLHFGEVSPGQVWAAVTGSAGAGGAEFRRQLAWREFAHHLLHHFPDTDREPLRPAYARMPWRDDPEALRRWQRGETGYELVDAGMRQLWHTGWMHNRVRMVAASFLTKQLLIHWREGARWFWDTLVDADLANNSLGWQWVAGSGADAAPFHRIFNPVAQARRFDPDGAYRDRWLGDGPRPAPIVELTAARERALGAYRTARELLG